MSVRKTGDRLSPTVAVEYEIDFTGEAKILKDLEVYSADEARDQMSKGGLDWLTYQRNLFMFELFGAGTLKAGEAKPFSSICVFSGKWCRSILKNTVGAY